MKKSKIEKKNQKSRWFLHFSAFDFYKNLQVGECEEIPKNPKAEKCQFSAFSASPVKSFRGHVTFGKKKIFSRLRLGLRI